MRTTAKPLFQIIMGIKRNQKFIIVVICLCGFLFVRWKWTNSSVLDSKRSTSEELGKAEEKIAYLQKLLKLQSVHESETELTKKLIFLQDKCDSYERILKKHNLLMSNEIPSERKLGRELDYAKSQMTLERDLTAIIFSFSESIECLKGRIDNVRKEYPKLNIIVSSSSNYAGRLPSDIDYIPDVKNEGKALEVMSTKVKTAYFLYLSSGVEISPHKDTYGIGWLLQTLENIPELDFVGGSFLRYETGVKYPVLEVPCHRLRMCNWTLSQTFEYRYSVDDMMVCEETSSSFMGRTSSLSKVPGRFDSDLDAMTTTDFFLRAKEKAVVGLRPEVRFVVRKMCVAPPVSKSEAADQKLPFMKKHQLYITKDSLGRETLASDSNKYGSLDFGNVHYRDGTFANPMYIRGLLLSLEVAADYLESKNITYFLDSGFSLGGIKMRGILPWDRDIDMGFFHDRQTVKEGLEAHCKAKGIKATISTSDLAGGKKELTFNAGLPNLGYNSMYQQDMGEENRPEKFMYIYIHGRKYPVKMYLFYSLRVFYGSNYLEMHGTSGRMKCNKPGHHACVPEEFEKGGGHWRDYYCQL